MSEYLEIARNIMEARQSGALPAVPDPGIPRVAEPSPPDYAAAARRVQRAELARHLRVSALGPSPDDAAEASRIAAETGVPASVVERELPEFRRGRPVDDVQARRLVDESPALARWLLEGDNARFARDDTGALERVGQALSSIRDDVAQQWRAGVDDVELMRLGYREALGTLGVGSGLSMAERMRLAELEAAAPREAAWWAGSAARILPTMLEGTAQGLERGLQTGMAFGTGAALLGQAGPQVALPEELVTVPAATATGFGVGFTAGLLEGSLELEGGGAFAEFRNLKDAEGLPIDPKAAALAALVVGSVNAGVETAATKYLLDLVPGFKALTGKARSLLVARVLQRPTVARALGTAAKGYAGGVGVETATEVLQEATTILGGELAKLVDGGSFEAPSAAEVVDRLAATAAETAKGMAILAAPGPVAGGVRDLNRARAARRDQAALAELAGASSESKLRGRLPERFRAAVERLAGEGGVESVYVPADQFRTFFQSEGVDPATVAAELGIAEQFQADPALAGDLVIPLPVFAEKIAGTRYFKGLSDHVRLRPDGMTPAEAAAFEAELEAEAAKAPAGDGEGSGKSGADRVFDDVHRQLLEAGRTADVAQREASLFRAFFATMGERAGVDPWDLYERQGLEIRREIPDVLRGLDAEGLDAVLGRARRPRNEATTEGGVDSGSGGARPSGAGASVTARGPRPVRAYLPDGREVEAQLEVVEADDLVTSNTDDLAVNPAFPPALQPRDRGRAASAEQIGRLAGRLVPELLGDSPLVSDGAPLIGLEPSGDAGSPQPRMVVESGNGRVLALRRAYGLELESAERYRAWLASQGFAVEGMRAPVLVRRRTTALDEGGREALVRSANARTTASMSATEQAIADAEVLGDDLLGLLRGGDVASRGNQAFVRAFLARAVPESELGQYVTKDGELSLDGRRRIRGALLARAYGDSAVVEKLLEEDEGALGPLGRALLEIAPAWARAADADATAGLMEAVRSVIRARDAAQPLDAALLQRDLFGERKQGTAGGELTDAGRAFLEAMIVRKEDGPARLLGKGALALKLGRLLDEIEKRGQGPDMTGAAPASAADTLRAIEAAAERAVRRLVEDLGLDLASATAEDVIKGTTATAAPETADALVGSRGPHSPASTLFQDDAPAVVLRGDALGDTAGDLAALRKAAREVYRRLQSTPARHAELGEIAFTRVGWDKVKQTGGDPRLWRMIPALREIVSGGRVVSTTEARPDRKDDIVRFHWLETTVELAGERLRVGFHVAEDRAGRKFYNINHDLDGWAQRYPGGRGTPVVKNRGRDGTDDTTLFQGGEDGLNLSAGPDSLDGAPLDVPDASETSRPLVSITPRSGRSLGQPKGSITFSRRGDGRARTVISLFQRADLSTFLHESGHFFLEVFADLAASAEASDALKGDFGALLAWLGVDSREAIGREQHEQFARGFEAYLAEGRAPAAELQGVFNRFRAWLVRVYRDLRALGVELSPEVRGVFDRLLAGDEAIREAEAAARFSPVFADGDQAGMTADEHRAYLEAAREATREAEERLLAERLQAELAERREAIGRDRERIRAEVAREVTGRPVYRAIRFLEGGTLVGKDGRELFVPAKLRGAKISAATVEREHGAETLKRLRKSNPGITGKGNRAFHPDALAELLAFESGAALVQAIADAPRAADVIDAETLRRLEARHGSLTDGSLEEGARAAVHGDKRRAFLLLELRALAGRSRQRATPMDVIRDAARRYVLAAKVPAILKPEHFAHAAQRAAREAQEAVAAGQWRRAHDAKRRQLFQFQAFVEAKRVQGEVDAALRKFGTLTRASSAARKTIPPAFLEQIDALLERFDFRRSITLRELKKRQALADFVRFQEGQGKQVDVDPKLLQEAYGESYRSMTVEDFLALRDAVAVLEHNGRMEAKLLAARREADFQAAVRGVVESIEANNTITEAKPDFAPSRFASLGRGLKTFMAAHIKMEFLFRQLDGHRHGPVWEALFKPLADAEAAEQLKMVELTREIGRIFGAYGRLERTRFYTRKVHVKEMGKSFTKASLLSLALNWGNEGNRQAVMTGYGWTEAQVDAALGNLDERDWRTVREVWKLVDSLWPEIAALQRDMTGAAPQKVEGRKVWTKFGIIEGGYYPLKYDGKLSFLAARRDEQQLAKELFGGNWTRPATRKGHTKERVGSAGQPVRLDLGVLGEHLSNVVHDLTHRRAILDTVRLVQHEDVRGAIEGAAGRELYRQILPWLHGIAKSQVDPGSVLDGLLGRARQGVSVLSMGWKVTTAISQPTGYLTTVKELGRRYAIRGITGFYGQPWAMRQKIDFVLERSPMMRTRRTSFDRDVQDAVRQMTQDGPLSGVQRSYFYLTGLMDMGVALPTWLGAYEKGLVDHAGDEAAAATYADSIVRMTQSSGGAKDLAAIQSGSEHLKIFTMFYSYFSVLFNQFADSVHRTDFTKASHYPRFVADMFWLWFAPAVLGALVIGRGPDDDEDWASWAGEELVKYPFLSVVLARDLVNGAFSEFGYEISPVVQALSGTVGTLKTIAEGEEPTRGETKEVLLTAGIWARLPGRQAWITGEFFYDWLVGGKAPESLGEALQYGLLQRRPEEERPR